ncbi:hypothetical protein Leryth_016343 [Lithospermum erythrorhizon]|nr:hypothetical protein Leryth_016343 [Lithospermum erythrorhizon]
MPKYFSLWIKYIQKLLSINALTCCEDNNLKQGRYFFQKISEYPAPHTQPEHHHLVEIYFPNPLNQHNKLYELNQNKGAPRNAPSYIYGLCSD